MNLLADEGVDFPIVCALRAIGYQITWIAEESPGISDSEILHRAAREKSLLLTADKDFGELVWRHRKPHAGVLLLRLPGLSESEKVQLVCQVISERAHQLAGNFSVLTSRELRIRQPPA